MLRAVLGYLRLGLSQGYLTSIVINELANLGRSQVILAGDRSVMIAEPPFVLVLVSRGCCEHWIWTYLELHDRMMCRPAFYRLKDATCVLEGTSW